MSVHGRYEMRGRRRGCGGVLVSLLAMLVAMPGQAIGAQNAPAALHLKFRLLARDVWDLSGSGRYVGYTRPYVRPPSEQFVLLDDGTGKRIAARWPLAAKGPSCGPGKLGGQWVGFDCANAGGPRFRFYDIATRKWRLVRCDVGCQQIYYFVDLVAVGTKWFALSVAPHESCGDGVHYTCGSTTYIYYNIATGRPRSPRAGVHTIIDLDSPTLTRAVCRPLPGSTIFPSPLTLYGPFALSSEQTGFYLRRCGSPLHMPLAEKTVQALIGNAQAVAYCPDAPDPNQQASGIFLPSLRRFTFSLPTGTRCWQAVLGPRHLYVVDMQRRLWVAPFPSKPPGSGSHH